jgi:hypothetical protein
LNSINESLNSIKEFILDTQSPILAPPLFANDAIAEGLSFAYRTRLKS